MTSPSTATAQATVARATKLAGTALHSGAPAEVALLPAAAGSGVVFVRADQPGAPELPAHPAWVARCERSTTLGPPGGGPEAQVGTVEHLMAAIWGLGLDNLRVEVAGPELPLLDGSAAPWCAALAAAGRQLQAAPRRRLCVLGEVRVGDADSWAWAAPAPAAQVTCSIDFGHPMVPTLPYTFAAGADPAGLARRFAAELAPARTFVLEAELAPLRARGLIAGGSLASAVVLSGDGVVNPEGLRFPDECVRHKALDALGDLALWGTGWRGAVRVHRAGHRLHVALARAVLAAAAHHRWEEAV